MVLATGKYTPKENIEDASEEQLRAVENIKATEEGARLDEQARNIEGFNYDYQRQKDAYTTATDYLGEDLQGFLGAEDITTVPDMRKPFTTRKILMQNPQFLSGARDFLQDKYNIAGTGLIFNGRKISEASDEEIFDKWLEHFRHFDSNLGTTSFDLHYVTLGQGSTESKREQYAYLYNNYRLLKGEWQDEDGSVNWGGAVQAFMDYGEGMLFDPTNWITAVPVWGQVQKAANVTALAGTRLAVANIVKKIGVDAALKKGSTALAGKEFTKDFLKGTAVGTGFGLAFTGLSQNTEIAAGIKDDFSWVEAALTTGVSGIAGGFLRGGVGALSRKSQAKQENLLAKHNENYKKNLDNKYKEATKDKSPEEIKDIEDITQIVIDDFNDSGFFKVVAAEGRQMRDDIAKQTGVRETVQQVNVDKSAIPTKGVDNVSDVESPLTSVIDVETVRNVTAAAIDLIKKSSPEDLIKYLNGIKTGKGPTGPKNKKISHVVFELLRDDKISSEDYGQFLSKFGLSHNDFKVLWFSTVSDAGKILKSQQDVDAYGRKAMEDLIRLDSVEPGRAAAEVNTFHINRELIESSETAINKKESELLKGIKNWLDLAKGTMVIMPSTSERNLIGSMYKVTFRGLSELIHNTFAEGKNLAKRTLGYDAPKYKETTRGIYPPDLFRAYGALYNYASNDTKARGILNIFDKGNKRPGGGFNSYEDELFTNYIEIEKKRTMENTYIDAGFKFLDSAVYAANIMNRTQEYAIRSIVFNDTLSRMLTQKGNIFGKIKDVDGNIINNLDDLIASGKIKDVVDDEMLAKSIKEALDTTYALEPEGMFKDFTNWFRFYKETDTGPMVAAKTAGQILVAFPRFMYNAGATALRYSPAGMLNGARKVVFKKGKPVYDDWTSLTEGFLGTMVIYGNTQARLSDAINSGSEYNDDNPYDRYILQGELIETPYDTKGNEPSFFAAEANRININVDASADLTPIFPIGFHNVAGKVVYDIAYRRDKINTVELGKDLIQSVFGSTVRTGQFGKIINELAGIIEGDENYDRTRIDYDAISNTTYETVGKTFMERFMDGSLAQQVAANLAPRVVPFMVATQAVEDVWSTYNPEIAKKRYINYSSFIDRMADTIPGYSALTGKPEAQSPFKEVTESRVGGIQTQTYGVRLYERAPWVVGELERLGITPYKALNFEDADIEVFDQVMKQQLGKLMQPAYEVGIPLILVNQLYLDQPDPIRREMLQKYIREIKTAALDRVIYGTDTQYIAKAREIGSMGDGDYIEYLRKYDIPVDVNIDRLTGDANPENLDLSDEERRVQYDIQREARERVDASLAEPEVSLSDQFAVTGKDDKGKEKEFKGGLLSP